MELRGIWTGRLVELIARCCGEPRELRLEVRALRGGLEAAGVAEVTARFSDFRGRPRSFGFVVKLLVGGPVREAAIYQHLVSPLGAGIAPAVLGIEHEKPDSCLLFLERVRPVRRWPWRDEAAAQRLLGRLAHLHAAAPPALALEVLSGWDYESELAERTRLAAELLEAIPREEDLIRLRRGLGSVRRVGEVLPELRRQLLAFDPLGTAAIHGDAHSGNALVRSGERPVLLDWGRARLGSPLEDVSSWLQSLGYWEPAARRRHDTLLAGYLAARGLPARAGRELRDAYWLAGASNTVREPCSSTSEPRLAPPPEPGSGPPASRRPKTPSESSAARTLAGGRPGLLEVPAVVERGEPARLSLPIHQRRPKGARVERGGLRGHPEGQELLLAVWPWRIRSSRVAALIPPS